MALIAQREAQLRAKEAQFADATRVLEGLEADLRDLIEVQSAWKQKILYKIMLASLRQNVARQRRLFQRMERINNVSHLNPCRQHS